MDPTTIAAVIGGITGVVAILMSLFMYIFKFGGIVTKINELWTAKIPERVAKIETLRDAKIPEQLRDIHVKLGKLEERMTFMTVYVDDLKRETKTMGLAGGSNDFYITKKGEEILPSNLKEELKDIAKSEKFRHIESVDDAMPLIIEAEIERLRNVSALANVSIGVAAMVASLYALKVRGEWVDETISKLEDENADVRWKALEALGMIGGTKAAEALTKALGDEHEPVRFKALEALVMIGAEAVEPLIKGLKDTSITVRYNSVAALRRIDSPKAKDALTEVSNNDKSTSVRSFAKEALKEIEAKKKST